MKKNEKNQVKLLKDSKVSTLKQNDFKTHSKIEKIELIFVINS